VNKGNLIAFALVLERILIPISFEAWISFARKTKLIRKETGKELPYQLPLGYGWD